MSTSVPQKRINNPSPLKTILLSGFIAGSLDILGAIIVYSIMMQKATATSILQSVASGAFGKDAFNGGTTTAGYGLLFHFIIAYCFAIAYFLFYPLLPFLKYNKIISGLFYGIIVWLIMNLIVLPQTNAYHGSFQWSSALTGCSILMLCIGLPIAAITDKYYRNQGA